MSREPLSLFDAETLARERLSEFIYDSIAGGATDEITVRKPRRIYDSIMLRPRRLVDVSQRDMTTGVLGHRISMPIMLAPAGFQERAHKDGELATAKAAGALGTVMVQSSGATFTLEEVAHAATGPIWFQHYLYSDRGLTKSMAQRAQEAGYSALCITVDASVPAKRERLLRSNFVNPPSANYAEVNEQREGSNTDGSQKILGLIDQSATWSYLEWLAANTPLPLVVKGILRADDAKLCAENGAKAVVVSNMGGTSLDTAISAIEVLPEIVSGVDGRIEIYVDGGIRRGTDVLKALALGARAVLVGRPIFWGLAIGGEGGVQKVFGILRDEFDTAMGMCGCPTVGSIKSDLVGKSSDELILQ